MLDCNLTVLILVKASLEMTSDLCFLCIIVSTAFHDKVEHIDVELGVTNRCNT
jgi:hypothetical protein